MDTDGFEVVQGDILNLTELHKAMRDVDAVVHLAAITGIDAVAENPVLTIKTNFLGAMNVLEIAKELGIKKIITFSSCEVYGKLSYKTDETAETVMEPVGDARISYAASKICADHLARSYYLKHGLPVTILRPFNIYGERQVGHGAISLFVNWALRDQPLIIYGDGLQIRAWCHVDDLMSAIPKLIENHKTDGEVLNIGNPSQAITILNLAEKIIEMTNSKSRLKFLHKRAVDVDVRVPNITKIKKLIGYQPKISIREGLKRTINFYREHDVKIA